MVSTSTGGALNSVVWFHTGAKSYYTHGSELFEGEWRERLKTSEKF